MGVVLLDQVKAMLQSVLGITNKSIAKAQETADKATERAAENAANKMEAHNPVGTGSFSMGRLEGSDVGAYSHAEGLDTIASGHCSHAEGERSTAFGTYSHAEGYDSHAKSSCSHAEGFSSDAYGDHSHAEGTGAQAHGEASHAEGCATKSTGKYSHAEGYLTYANGENSHAEGWRTTANDNGSHAEGWNTTASGQGSHAEGQSTTASKTGSHAEGSHTTASNAYSHAEGQYTFTSCECQHVQGQYNADVFGYKYAHIVGNGTAEARSNAHTLDWEGNAWFAGDVYVGGSSQDDGEKLVKKSELDALAGSTDTNVFVVNFSNGEADATFEEIKAACDAGKVVVVLSASTLYTAMSIDLSDAVFSHVYVYEDSVYISKISISANGIVDMSEEYYEPPASGASANNMLRIIGDGSTLSCLWDEFGPDAFFEAGPEEANTFSLCVVATQDGISTIETVFRFYKRTAGSALHAYFTDGAGGIIRIDHQGNASYME